MKATKKLLSMLLLAAMMMGLAVPASASWTDEGNEVGRVTADMMYNEPAVVEQDMTVGNDASSAAVIEGTGASASSAASGQANAKVLVTKADGSQASYSGIVDALTAASSGDVLTLNYDPSYGVTFNVDKSLTILLNGHTIYVSVPGTNPAMALSGVTLRGGSVVITASTVSVGPNDPPPTYSAGITGSGTLDGVHVYYTGPGRMMSGGFTVYGGSYSSDPSIYLTEGFEAYLVDGRYKIRAAQPVEEPAEEEELSEQPEGEESELPLDEDFNPEEVVGTVGDVVVVDEVTYEETSEETPAAPEEPNEETPAAPEEPSEETPAAPEEPSEETPAAPEEPSEETPSAEEPSEELPAANIEVSTGEPEADNSEPQSEEPSAEPAAPSESEQSDPSLLDRIVGLFENEDPNVDPAAQDIPHNLDKAGSACGATVTVAGAADEDELTVAAASGYEAAVTAAAGEVRFILALDISLSGERTEPVDVTIESDTIKTLSEAANLYHVTGESAEPVIFSINREAGTISFQASSFSPYVIVEPDEMLIQNEDEEEDMDLLQRPIGNRYGNASGSMQFGMDQLEPNEGTIDMMANTAWDVTDWRTFTQVIINTRGYKITGADITVPAGVTLSIYGSGSGNFFDVDGRNINIQGNLILTGTMKINGNINVNGGSLTVNGHNVTVVGTTTVNGGSCTIEGGKFGTFTAAGGSGGISGGTFANEVPAFMLDPGCVCTETSAGWVVGGEAAVRTIDNSIKFTRGGGNYVEYYKGAANASLNYTYQFNVTPVAGLTSVTLVSGGFTGYPSYVYDNVTGRVTIHKSANEALMNDAPAGRAYFQFRFTSGALIEVPINIYPSVTYDPQVYYIDSFEPVVFTLSPNALTGFDDPAYITVDMKVGRDDPYKVQLPTTAYSYSGNKITLSASYLNGLKPGMHTFDFWYDMEFGKVIQLSCKVAVYVDYKVIQINAVNLYKSGPMADVNWYQYSGRNLSFTANGDASKFVGVRVDGKLLASTSYMWSGAGAGKTNVQLYPGYLAGLAQGKHVIEILFSDGVATADFAILSGSASPKTGDNNHVALWVGLLVLSGAAVVALIPKKKKQKSR